MDEEVTVEMINYALEKEAEDAAWDIWVAIYPNFNNDNFVPFSEFKDSQVNKKPKAPLKPWSEIQDEMEEVVKQFEERKRGGQ